jgi:hypothetical protein
MTPEQINIAIAEHCGWTGPYQQEWVPDICPTGGDYWCFAATDAEGCRSPLPSYYHDLNTMHEAEKTLTLQEKIEYYRLLIECQVGEQFVFQIPAAQRAEAFLRTVGKWEDGK